MLKKCYDGEFFHEHITGDKIIGKTSNILGTIRNNRREFPKLAKSAKDELKLLYKSNNCIQTIHKSKPINKITIIINTKHKSVQIDNDRKRLPETVITKLNSASMSPVKCQESTVSNQNHIDGPCKFSSTSLIFPTCSQDRKLWIKEDMRNIKGKRAKKPFRKDSNRKTKKAFDLMHTFMRAYANEDINKKTVILFWIVLSKIIVIVMPYYLKPRIDGHKHVVLLKYILILESKDCEFYENQRFRIESTCYKKSYFLPLFCNKKG
ncbi:piggyBac transposable element-derived protein 3-like [Vespula squamosa]|uniref:PiggyBac transposable element-derived protein 3-like n=1 Tax=Vespula squamosa TaxID=30214 RepID=A0ABD2BWA3_VESSQ